MPIWRVVLAVMDWLMAAGGGDDDFVSSFETAEIDLSLVIGGESCVGVVANPVQVIPDQRIEFWRAIDIEEGAGFGGGKFPCEEAGYFRV